jgi:hypothetical protein
MKRLINFQKIFLARKMLCGFGVCRTAVCKKTFFEISFLSFFDQIIFSHVFQ